MTHDAEIADIRKRLVRLNMLGSRRTADESVDELFEIANSAIRILDARAEAAPVVPVVPTPRRHTAECAIHTLGTIKSCNCMPVDAVKEALILDLRRLVFKWDDDPNFAISDIADALLSSNILRPMPTWQPIETAPKGLKLLVGYANSLGNWRTVTATYYLPRTLEIDYADYNADDEDGYAKEGWYDETETHDTVMPLEGGQAPTHWQHLPPKPINPSTGDK